MYQIYNVYVICSFAAIGEQDLFVSARVVWDPSCERQC